jgi:phage gp36-like protein
LNHQTTINNQNLNTMSNLLSIESSFLNLPQVKTALNLSEIRSVQRTITNAKKKKFEQTLQLSKLVTAAVEWFQSEEGQRVCSEEGISWSNEEIGQKVFGWQKSFFYKVVKAGRLDAEVVETFKAKCDEVEAQGQEPNRSLEGLLKFAKQVSETAQGGGESDGEGGEDSESNEPQVETRVETILTFTYKSESGNVSVRIDSEGNVKTTNSLAEIAEALAVFQFSIQNQN